MCIVGSHADISGIDLSNKIGRQSIRNCNDGNMNLYSAEIASADIEIGRLIAEWLNRAGQTPAAPLK